MDNQTVGQVLTTIIFLSLIPAFIGAYIGERRGVMILGFFLGLFLSFLGWIFIMLIDKSVKCPACGSKLKAKGAFVCAACGRDIRNPANYRHVTTAH
jgi:DNA-directed RNA polymerase subunit RPC12/RpoP